MAEVGTKPNALNRKPFNFKEMILYYLLAYPISIQLK